MKEYWQAMHFLSLWPKQDSWTSCETLLEWFFEIPLYRSGRAKLNYGMTAWSLNFVSDSSHMNPCHCRSLLITCDRCASPKQKVLCDFFNLPVTFSLKAIRIRWAYMGALRGKGLMGIAVRMREQKNQMEKTQMKHISFVYFVVHLCKYVTIAWPTPIS